jgi:hypothetical protein
MGSVIHNTGAGEMSKIIGVRRRRRNAKRWRELLSRFGSSGLEVSTFRRCESVSTASFYRWRSRLGGDDCAVTATEPSPAAFVDLGALNCGLVDASGGIELRLDLGGGLSLHLVRR